MMSMPAKIFLRDVARRVLPHAGAHRFTLAPGAHPAGLYLDEGRGLLAVAELGTRRISILDARAGQVLNRIPLTATVDIALREQTIGGAFLSGYSGVAYFWSGGATGRLRRLVVSPTGEAQVESQVSVGGELLRDWLFDPVSGRVALTIRDDPHLYLADGELRIVRVLPLGAPGGSMAVLRGAKAMVLLDSPEEPAFLVDLAAGRVLTSAAPWSELRGFPSPPVREPFFTAAPFVVAPDGSFAYVGSHRTDAANRASPLVALRLPQMILESLLADERLATPSRLAIHPTGLELYVSGDVATLVVDPQRMEIIGELGPGRLTALEVSPSGHVAVAVDLGITTVFLFDGTANRTLTAPLTPDPDPSELLSVPAIISEVLGVAYVADRFGDAVLVLPLS
jgi:hypothetical protein